VEPLEIYEMPADFIAVCEFRNYLNRVAEEISFHDKVSDPPYFVKMTPLLFMKWLDFARYYTPASSGQGEMLPLGTRIGPSWLRWEFSGLQDFVEYYEELLKDASNI
jgi:hypothetical protein